MRHRDKQIHDLFNCTNSVQKEKALKIIKELDDFVKQQGPYSKEPVRPY